MIQANELSKGNRVLYSPSGKKNVVKDREVVILEIRKKTIIVQDLGFELELFYESAAVKPIPLTPEILEKCGFHALILRDSSNGFIRYVYKIIVFKSYNGVIDFNESLMLSKKITHIKYLHQLQNIVFASTNTELAYKP